jgi:hypothetical protein
MTFRLARAQDILQTNAGVTQVTTHPDRRWFAQLQIVPQSAANILAWSLALDQLSDRANVFALTPPYYAAGPSTGYSGANPLVAGASQTGLTLNVDGLPVSTAILLAGDFCSFDVTSVGGSVNRQLNKVTANVTSDGAGLATFNLLLPIRQAPANNATVVIDTPSAQFMLSNSESVVDLQLAEFAEFVVDAEERIFP